MHLVYWKNNIGKLSTNFNTKGTTHRKNKIKIYKVNYKKINSKLSKLIKIQT